MKIYVIETIYDYLCQCGASLNEELALQEAEKLNKMPHRPGAPHKYWVTEYEISDKKYTDFE